MIGERIKELRKALSLTQTAFGERIGLKQNSVALIEAGRATSDQTIFAICREFRANEVWLRTGEGEMFVPSPETVVEQLAEEYHLCPEAQAMVEKFITLDPAAQLAVFDYMCAVVDEIRGKQPGKNDPPTDDDYRAMLEDQLKKEKGDAEKSEA